MNRTTPLLTRFTQLLKFLNPTLALAGPEAWLFAPGMLFRDSHTWWGAQRPRATAHEGVDFHAYRQEDGQRAELPLATRLPLVFPGQPLALNSDFLGHSLWVRHFTAPASGLALHSVSAHLQPVAQLARPAAVGSCLAAGAALGTLARPASGSTVPAHFHLTIFWAPPTLDPAVLTWSTVTRHQEVSLIDPVTFFC